MWVRNTLFRVWLSAGVVIVPVSLYLLGQRSAGVYIACYLAWVMIYVAGKLLYRSSELKATMLANQNWQQQLANFKQNAEVITVVLSECDILTNNYILEHDGYNSNQPIMAGFKITAAQQGRNITRQSVTKTQLIYECTYRGSKAKFVSPVLAIPKESLLFLFDKQKETKLYVQNEQHYYFDVAFVG